MTSFAEILMSARCKSMQILQIWSRIFQRVFHCKFWLRYRRDRSFKSSFDFQAVDLIFTELPRPFRLPGVCRGSSLSTLDGSFSAASTPISASQGFLSSSFQACGSQTCKRIISNSRNQVARLRNFRPPGALRVNFSMRK